ncbi:MAG TPA: PAS domain-containing protein [Prolixibacteraceae bacterium]|nr:PAS domain-containing protein [Prolixibacteraceae bacterium]
MNYTTSHSQDIPPLYLRLFEAVPGNNLLLKADSPQYTLLAVSEGFLQLTGKTKEEIMGKGLWEAFPSNSDYPEKAVVQEIKTSLNKVITTKKAHQMSVQRYDFAHTENQFSEKFWKINNSPLLSDKGEVLFIINSIEDYTKEVSAGKREEEIKPLQQAHNLYMQAPMAIQIFTGPDLITELANDQTLKMWGRDESARGKPFLEILPELKGQGYEHLMQEVIQTGIPKSFYEVPIVLNKKGKEVLGYYNFFYQPYYKEDKTKATGVLVFSTEVTEQVLTKKRIQESELHLELAIEIAELGVFNIDLKTNKTTYTRQIMDWLGLKEQYMPFSEIFARVYPEDVTMVVQTMERSMIKESWAKHNLIFRIIHPETGQMQYLNSIGQVQFEGKNAVSIKGIMQNVTEQMSAHKKLKESEQKLRSILENAPFPIAVLIGKEMRIELANQNILDVWGKGNIIGKTYYEMLPEIGQQGVFELLRNAYNTGVPIHMKHQPIYFLVKGKKRHFYFNYSFIPLFNDLGEVYGMTITASDVTDLILSRKKVEESSQNLQNMIMQAPVAMCILKEPNHIVTIANDRQLELWGKDRSQVMNKPITEALPESKTQGLKEVLDKIYTTGEMYEAFELPLSIYRNGKMESIYVNIEQRAYREPNGTISGIMAVTTEVTELVIARHKIEEVVAERTRELAEAYEALQQNNRELQQFAYVAAHDLQEPLRTISNFVGLFVKKYGNISADSEKYAGFILNATSKMQNMIKDLLDYSTIGSNQVFVLLDLNEVLLEVVAEMDHSIQESKAEISCAHLPLIHGNAIEIKRLFQNLLSNAIKFRKVGVVPRIRINAWEKESEVLFSFKDNGIGIEEQYRAKLFTIFQRLHTAREYPGTGIGLAICKKVVTLHGGRIGVESEPGKGSTFYFTIARQHS